MSFKREKLSIMKFVNSNNHIILPVETNAGMKNALLDTGAGMTVCLDSQITELKLGDAVVRPWHIGLDYQAVNELVGMEIAIILGTDQFADKDILIDFATDEISFNAPKPQGGAVVDIDTSLMGLPVLRMTVNGHSLRAAFDAGAKYPFVASNTIAELNLGNVIGQFEDYNPTLGNFTPSLYKCNLSLGTCEFADTQIAASPAYDKAAARVNVQAFLGISPFAYAGARLWLSYPTQQMVIVK